jgi:hypothetical protein
MVARKTRSISLSRFNSNAWMNSWRGSQELFHKTPRMAMFSSCRSVLSMHQQYFENMNGS